MTLAGLLASHAIGATPNLSSAWREGGVHPEDRVVDVLGCMFAGTSIDSARRAAALIAGNSADGRSTVASGRAKVKPAAAAQANALLARAYDFGPLTPFDGETPLWSHISETTVPAALAMAEETKAPMHAVLAALTVGDDVAARISRALKFLPGTGWDSPGLVNRFASAVIAARLWNLDERELIQAWGLVLQQVSGTFQAIDEHSDAFTYVQGLAARDGIEAVDLVRSGYSGGAGGLDGRFGLFQTFGSGLPEMASVVGGLGDEYLGDQIFKPYPGCRFTHGPIDIARGWQESQKDFSLGIREIFLTVHPHHIDSPLDHPVGGGEPLSRTSALFSFQFQTANALLRGMPLPSHFDDASRNDPAVRRLAGLIRLLPAPEPSFELTAAHIHIHMSNGGVLAGDIDYPWGDPRGVALTRSDIDAKFTANLRHAGIEDDPAAVLPRLRDSLRSNSPFDLSLFPALTG